MKINATNNNSNINNVVSKGLDEKLSSYKSSIYKGEKATKKQNIVGYSLIGVIAAIVLFVKHRQAKGVREFSNKLTESSRNKFNEVIKGYRSGSRLDLVCELEKNKDIKQTKPADISKLVKDAAKCLKIKSKAEETFSDKLERWISWV